MYFHVSGVAVGGITRRSPGWYLWAPGAAQSYGAAEALGTQLAVPVWEPRRGGYLREAGVGPGRFYPSEPGAVVVDAYFARLFDERSLYGTPHAGILGAQAVSLIYEVGRSLADEGAGSRSAAVVRAKRYLDAHMGRIVPLEEVARASAVSVAHLCALFKSAYGEPLGRYHLRGRMDLAAFYLAERGYGVGQTAEKVGYPDIYTYSRMFKRIRGVPPSAVRALRSR